MVGANGRSWSGQSGVGAEAADGPWPKVASDESSGVFRVRDPRVFRAGGRVFCRSWLDAAVRHAGVRKAGVDLSTATALIEFEPGKALTATMAEIFAGAVREALANPSSVATDRADWVALAGFAGPDSPAWEVSRRSSDRLELRPPDLGVGNPRRAAWLARVADADGVTGCRSAWFSDALTVAYNPSSTNEDRILAAVRLAWLESCQGGPGPRPVTDGIMPAIDPRARAANLVKAGGLFALTLVGIVVPGIPTIPFLLGTSFYLARSSPRLNARCSSARRSSARSWANGRSIMASASPRRPSSSASRPPS